MKTLIALTLALAGIANAGTVNLPDPTVFVNPNYGNNTTIVTMLTLDAAGNVVDSKTYRGPSQYVYFSECAKPDSTRYHCNILVESDVVLTAPDGSTVTVDLTIQQGANLVTSGHNYWRSFAVVLAGEVRS